MIYSKQINIKESDFANFNLTDIIDLTVYQTRALNIFWAGFLIYILGYVLGTTETINQIICQLIQSIGIVLFLPPGFYLAKANIKNSYLRILFTIYSIYILIVVFRGITFRYDSLKYLLFNADYGLFLYFVPYILLFPKKLLFYKKLFDVIIISGVCFILFDIVFIKKLLYQSSDTQDFIEYFSKILSITCGFLLLTFKYHSKKRIFFSAAVMLISLLISVYQGRRGLTFICSSILAFSFLIFLFNTKWKILVIYLFILAVTLGLFYASNMYRINQKGLLGLFENRVDDDTRSGVELYFYNDMKPTDWAIGKGINGEYFCPGIDEDAPTDYRNIIETGYLQIILKGGITRLALYLLIAVPAIILGLFFSKNLLSKAAGIWIFISLISLYPATVNSFNLNYLLVWISIGICYSKDLRILSDGQIADLIHTPSTVKTNH